MKKIFNNRLLGLLVLVTLIKGIVFSIIVPIWQGPDEQAHFGQIANYAEFGQLPKDSKNLNREILFSENLLGTFRDKYGNNNYTFHPEYKIEFSDSLSGKHETEISTLPKNYRKELTINESTAYPPLFYWAGTLIYWLFFTFDLFSRVFMVRIISILCVVGITIIAFKIGEEIFNENKLLSFTLATLVSFQPMITFVGASVNSDNLMTLLFSAGIYLAVLILNKRMQRKYLLSGLIIFLLGMMTKPQFILIIPIWGFVYLVNLISGQRTKKFWLQILILMILFGCATIFVIYNYSQSLKITNDYSFSIWDFSKFTLRHTVREVIPWYWGVFDWLGVVYPIEVIRTINRILILAAIGLSLRIIINIRKKRFKNLKPIFLMIFCSIIYFLGISIFDYLYILSSHGISIGVQGRYFFPTIIAQMVLLLIGLLFFIPKKFQEVGAKIIGLTMILLNFFALFVILNTYYHLTSRATFFTELSQYKPGIYKYPLSAGYFICYLFVLGIFLYKYVHLKYSKND